MTEAAIDPGIFRDLFIAMGEPVGGDAWAIHSVQADDSLDMVWRSAGGLWCPTTALDRRYRLQDRRALSSEQDLESPAMPRLKFFLPLAAFCPAGHPAVSWAVLDPTALPSALMASRCPSLRWQSAHRAQSRESLVGAPMLINVWATWCYSCRVEHTLFCWNLLGRASKSSA